jgi:hypothetical protein
MMREGASVLSDAEFVSVSVAGHGFETLKIWFACAFA